MPQTTAPNFKLAGIIQIAHARMKRESTLHPKDEKIQILRYGITVEYFSTCLEELLKDRSILTALVFLTARGIKVIIGGAYGDWIYQDEDGTIRIRHDVENQRVKEFFGIPTTEKE